MREDIQLLHSLRAQGDCCAQVMVHMGLMLQERENDELVDAAAALCGGVYAGKLCGAATGAAMMLALFDRDLARTSMIPALMQWFEEHTQAFGGTDCSDIVQGNPLNKMERCPKLIEATYRKAVEILAENGFTVPEGE